jgi:hypothetical protein
MNPKRLAVDFVGGNVDVLVIGIVVPHREVLVLGKSRRIDEFVDNLLELPSLEAPITEVKRDDEVIRALAAGPRDLRLNHLDERARKLEVVSSPDAWPIGGAKPGGTRPG